MSKNKVNLMGWIGSDPELKTIESSNGTTSVSNARMSTKSVYKDKSGTRQESTTWHSLTFWGVNAENFARMAKKGSHIDIEGKLDYDEWEDDSGTNRIKPYIDVREFRLLDKKADTEAT